MYKKSKVSCKRNSSNRNQVFLSVPQCIVYGANLSCVCDGTPGHRAIYLSLCKYLSAAGNSIRKTGIIKQGLTSFHFRVPESLCTEPIITRPTLSYGAYLHICSTNVEYLSMGCTTVKYLPMCSTCVGYLSMGCTTVKYLHNICSTSVQYLPMGRTSVQYL
jgi:hypothetical protein